MGEQSIGAITAIVTAVIGLAIIAVLVSNRAQTGSVIGSAGTALSNVISAAVAPVTGGGSSNNVISSIFGSGG